MKALGYFVFGVLALIVLPAAILAALFVPLWWLLGPEWVAGIVIVGFGAWALTPTVKMICLMGEMYWRAIRVASSARRESP